MKDELLIGKPRRILTRLGRLRPRSGSKLPEATGPLRALEMVDCRGQGAWDCLRGAVRDRVPPTIAITDQHSDFQLQFLKKDDFGYKR